MVKINHPPPSVPPLPIKFYPIRDFNQVKNKYFRHFTMNTAREASASSSSSSRKRKASVPAKNHACSSIIEKRAAPPQQLEQHSTAGTGSVISPPPVVHILTNDLTPTLPVASLDHTASAAQPPQTLDQLIDSLIFEENPVPPQVQSTAAEQEKQQQQQEQSPTPLALAPTPPLSEASPQAKFESTFQTRNPPWKNFKTWVVQAYTPHTEQRAAWEQEFGLKVNQIHDAVQIIQAFIKALESSGWSPAHTLPLGTSSPNNNNNKEAAWSLPPPPLLPLHHPTKCWPPAAVPPPLLPLPPTHCAFERTIPFQIPPQATLSHQQQLLNPLVASGLPLPSPSTPPPLPSPAVLQQSLYRAQQHFAPPSRTPTHHANPPSPTPQATQR